MTISVPRYDLQFGDTPSSGLAVGLDPGYQLKQRQVDALDTFKNGLPTVNNDPNGPVDWNAAAKMAMSKGSFDTGAKMLDIGIQQRQLDEASKLSGGMTKWLTPGGGDAQPTSAPSSGGGYMPLFQSAISGIESGGKYDAQGPVTKNGDQAFGRYQVMGANVGPWTKEILGQELTPEQFLASPQAQDAVFNGKFGSYLKQYGNPRDAASMWFSGKPYAQGQDKQDQLGTTGASYVGKFMTALQSGDAARSLRGQSNSQPSLDPQPVQVAQQGDSDAPAPSGQHPFAPPMRTGPGAPPKPPSLMAFSSGQSGPAVAQSTRADAGVSPAPVPQPQSFMSPPPISPNIGGMPHPLDPSFGGQVPQAWLNAGHSAGEWVSYARSMAALGSANPYAKGAAEQWSKIADGLASSIDKSLAFTNEQKNARDPTAVAYEQQRDSTKYQAREGAKLQNAAAVKEAQQEGETYGKIPGQLAADADSARSQNAMIDEMLDASRQFNMGKFADKEQALNSTMSALGQKLGVDTSSINGKVAAYEDFGKLAGQFSRQAMKEAGSRTGGIQELKFITNTLPSPTMSQNGFEAVANQLKGLNDFKAAKQSAGEAWLDKTGSMRGFDTMWNKQVSPSAFVMHRLQVEQPDVFSTTVSRLAQSAQGRAALQHMRSGMAWAGSAGLLD